MNKTYHFFVALLGAYALIAVTLLVWLLAVSDAGERTSLNFETVPATPTVNGQKSLTNGLFSPVARQQAVNAPHDEIWRPLVVGDIVRQSSLLDSLFLGALVDESAEKSLLQNPPIWPAVVVAVGLSGILWMNRPMLTSLGQIASTLTQRASQSRWAVVQKVWGKHALELLYLAACSMTFLTGMGAVLAALVSPKPSVVAVVMNALPVGDQQRTASVLLGATGTIVASIGFVSVRRQEVAIRIVHAAMQLPLAIAVMLTLPLLMNNVQQSTTFLWAIWLCGMGLLAWYSAMCFVLKDRRLLNLKRQL